MSTNSGILWADITEGQALAPLTFPITYSTLAKDVAGTRDLYPIHHDPAFAKGNGARDIFLNTMFYQGLIGRFVNAWAGPQSFLRKLSISMTAHGCPGDVLTLRGTVSRAYRGENGVALVDLAVSIDNHDSTGHDHTGAVVARVTVEIP